MPQALKPEHIRRYAKTIHDREEKLLEFLKGGPKTLEVITANGIIYGPPRVISGWDLSVSERAMMKKHLEWLEKKGMVQTGNTLFHLI